jgi:glycosyltransferase involved in cell wall biosynthesis
MQRIAEQPRVLIVSPVRNEARHIARVVRAVAAQELAPARWIVIDDGSTDETLRLLLELEREVPFLTVMRASESVPADGVRDRLAHAVEVRNFNFALSRADLDEYTHVMKLDGDIELAPDYLRRVIERFVENPRLGLVGGVLDEPCEDGRMTRIGIPDHHIHGALKCYSRACFEAIGGVQERLGWDTIDETYARMRGFETRTFRDLVSIHRRPLGSADGTVRGHARHGVCAYVAHYSVAWVLLRSFKIATRRPRGLAGLAFLYGYVRAATHRIERVPDPEFRRFTRRELRRRMLFGGFQTLRRMVKTSAV